MKSERQKAEWTAGYLKVNLMSFERELLGVSLTSEDVKILKDKLQRISRILDTCERKQWNLL